MLVARSFSYGPPPPDAHVEKSGSPSPKKISPIRAKVEHYENTRTPSAPLSPGWRIVSEPPTAPSKPVSIPTRSHSSAQTLRNRGAYGGRRSSRDGRLQEGLPPAVAALLAATAIPPPRKDQPGWRRQCPRQRRISIDELVREWRSDESLMPLMSSSPAMSILLERVDAAAEESFGTGVGGEMDPQGLTSRSTSSDSIPSLDGDDQSSLSLSDPSTPPSVRSRKSNINLARKEKSRSLPRAEECVFDHPLLLPAPEVETLSFTSLAASKLPPPKPQPKRSVFKSNLTSAIKSATRALTALSDNVISNNAAHTQPLWSRPYIFPRISSEKRPVLARGLPDEETRRYFNPLHTHLDHMHSTYQHALCSPTDPPAPAGAHGRTGEEEEEATMIPLQPFSRTTGRKQKARSRPRSSPTTSPPPHPLLSEAGRPPTTARQRELRENSDFLRVVVLEMNMRRRGKLDEGVGGRARIWLPPRKEGGLDCGTHEGRVPRRWRGVSA
ncbi:hypothetical protein LTR66_002075 [Elasticomyces elasticus]|nr:hypothetical protein LTR66_002075 [Elasticomyces elasticus]KAK5009383.1 hypothetical protein LTR28_001282 [Elasticomyces elasticus]